MTDFSNATPEVVCFLSTNDYASASIAYRL